MPPNSETSLEHFVRASTATMSFTTLTSLVLALNATLNASPAQLPPLPALPATPKETELPELDPAVCLPASANLDTILLPTDLAFNQTVKPIPSALNASKALSFASNACHL